MKSVFSSLVFTLLCALVVAQSSLLQSGPMVGYADFREVMLWVQTTEEAEVIIEYWDVENPSVKFKTEKEKTKESKALTAKLLCNQVDFGKKYEYKVYINEKAIKVPYATTFKTQQLWQFRMDPPTITFAFGSCNYVNEEKYDRPGKAYGTETDIFNAILNQKPDFMVWLGDNTYLRDPDWNTQTGIYHRYTHTRSQANLQPLLGSVPHYAIWDDHDYGSNDADYTFPYKNITEKTFHQFWCNPNTNQTGDGGVTFTFTWGDIQFFMLDNRYFRTPNNKLTGDRAIIGKKQEKWLIDAMVSSTATFKIVCIGGQFLNPAAVYENHATYNEEREHILKAIDKEKLEGVLFLTGDRHHAELTKLSREGAYPLYDFTSSPLSAGTHVLKDEGNTAQVEGTLFGEHNFGIIEVSGIRTDRTLTMKLFDKTGKLVWERAVKRSDLSYPKQ